MKRLFTTLCFLILSLNLKATTYYIDYQTGSDSNNGLSKATPWKTHPWQAPRYGSGYSHSTGDRFIYKGGVTWPLQNVVTIVIKGSGSASNPDYYGVDKTWYIGPQWTKPKFDAQGLEFNGGWCVGIQIEAANPQHDIIFDNIAFVNWYWSSVIRQVGGVANITIANSYNITISNCDFLGWSHAPYGGNSNTSVVEDQFYNILGSTSAPFNSGCVITNCLFDGITPANQVNGTASCAGTTFMWGGKVINSTIRNTAGGIFLGPSPSGQSAEVSGCSLGPIFVSYDPFAHDDGIMNNGGHYMSIHDNYIFDVKPVPMFLMNGYSGETNIVYNNVLDFRNQTQQTPISLNTTAGGGKLFLYNNTMVAGPGFSQIRVVYRNPGSNVNLVDSRNNLFIGEGSIVTIDSGATLVNYINQNNLQMSYAAAQSIGYTRANWYKPTTSVSPTVNLGQDLSSVLSGVLTRDLASVVRPQGSAWDIGAFEWQNSVTPPTPQPPNTPINGLPLNGTSSLPTYGFTMSITGYSDPQSLPMIASRFLIKQGSTIIYDLTTNVTSFNIPQGILASGTTYNFSAAVENNANLWSQFSTPTTFSTAALQNPNSPFIISPANGATNQSLTLTLVGSPYSDPQNLPFSQRDWQIVSGINPIYAITNTSTSLTISSNILNYYTLYGITIRDKNSSNMWSSYGPVSVFTTITNPLVIIPTNTPPQVGAPYNVNFSGTVNLKGTFYFSR